MEIVYTFPLFTFLYYGDSIVCVVCHCPDLIPKRLPDTGELVWVCSACRHTHFNGDQ